MSAVSRNNVEILKISETVPVLLPQPYINFVTFGIDLDFAGGHAVKTGPELPGNGCSVNP